jgi:hypothetical protein
MSVRIGVRRIVLFTTAACLLLASSHTPAQAPPATPDAEQRLKALEDKMDRVLKLLEPRMPATPEEATKTREQVIQARDAALIRFERDQQAYMEFRAKSPFTYVGKDADSSFVAQQLAKDHSLRQDLHQRQSEVSTRSALVKNVGDNENQARALLILLQRRGVDVELLRRTGTPGRDEAATAVASVRLYGESLGLEAEELERLIWLAEQRIDQNQKVAIQMIVNQTVEERLRNARDQSAKFLDALHQQITRMDVTQNVNPKR